MPVRSRSRCSTCARYCLELRLKVAQFVQILINAGSDHAAIAQGEWRLGNERAVDLLAQIA